MDTNRRGVSGEGREEDGRVLVAIPRPKVFVWLLVTILFVTIGGWVANRPAAMAQTSTLRFAVIGDYGTAGSQEAVVSAQVKSWNTDLVITTGDNNYPVGGAATIDQNIGQYYSQFIHPYVGAFPGALGVPPNRFFPALGNHDVDSLSCSGTVCSGPYFDYFTLPGNERYYDFVQGPVHFFMLNSDEREPDGITATSVQATWLRNALAASTARWKVVVFHHSPYSSSTVNGSELRLRWPFAEWGATLVLTGHNHNYERLSINGFPFIINGSGGTSLYPFAVPIAGSLVRYSSDYGAMLVDANDTTMTLSFYTKNNQLIDSVTLPDLSPTPTPPAIGSAEVRIQQSSDDVEEQISTGFMVLNSTDMELIEDTEVSRVQRVGLRFLDLNVPQGALITSAYLEFIVDETGSSPTNLTIRSHATDDAAAFAATNYNLSSRALNGPSIVWSDVPAWEFVGEAKRSPDISVLVQAVVNRSGWRPGNAMSFAISGSGKRTAVAFDGDRFDSVLLHIDWSLNGNVPTPTETPIDDNPTATFTPTPIPPTATLTPTPEVATATFTPTPAPVACSGTGSIVRDVWTGIAGSSISDLTNNPNYPNNPSSSTSLTSFEGTTNAGDSYGSRIRGYICPPISGLYTFWIASDDQGQLWLSNNNSPNNKQQIALVPGWTSSRQWDKFPEQRSLAISLNAGTLYYIEALQKEGNGGDNLAVAWQGPSLSQQVITGQYLAPFVVTPSNGVVDIRVSRSADDAEQATNGGVMYLGSSDLEFGRDTGGHGGAQVVGVRFQGINIPRGATISNAYLEFVSADADTSRNANYVIRAHAADNSGGFGSTTFSLSSRALTTAQSNWSPAGWTRANEVKRSAGLRTVVQEIVNRSGWRSGNAMSFIINGGPGRRAAYSYDLSVSSAPLLHIEWSINTTVQVSPEDTPIQQAAVGPQLVADYDNGGPGSIFKIFGSGYPANASSKLLVNGEAIATLRIDTNGEFAVELPTTNAQLGTLTISLTGHAETYLVLEVTEGLPLRGPLQESEEEALGSAEERIYLPLISH